TNKTLTLNTGGGDLTISAASKVTGGNNLVINLGGGNFVANATLTAVRINTSLTAAAITGTATKALALGTGSFTALARSTANVTLNNTGNGLGGVGLLQPGTKVTAGNFYNSLITTGTVTINGVDSSNASNLAATLTNITGSSISVVGATNKFVNDLTLESSNGNIDLNGTLTVGNAKTLTLNTKGNNLNLSGNSSVTGGTDLYLNLGAGAITGGKALTASGAVYYRGALSGNNATLVTGGVFYTVIKKSGDYTLLASDIANTTPGGLTVTAKDSYTDFSTDGVLTVSGIDASSNKSRLYLYGSAINVSGSNQFGGDLTLDSSGKIDLKGGIDIGSAKTLKINASDGGVNISAGLSINGGSILSFDMGSKAITGGGTIDAIGLSVSYTGTATTNNATLNAASFYTTLEKTGPYALSANDILNTVPNGLTVNAKINRVINVSGEITVSGIDASAKNYGLFLSGSKITVTGANKFGGDVSLYSNSNGGINLKDSIQMASGKVLALRTANGGDLNLTGDATITGGTTLRIDLRSGGKITGNNSLIASGFDVLYSGATTNNNAAIDIGKGQFVYVTDRSNVTDPTVLTKTTLASDATLGWDITGFGSWTTASGGYKAGGLTVKTLGTQSSVNGVGVVYGGTVDIQGITAASAVGKLNYIQGAGISVTDSASTFAGALTLVSNGSGVSAAGNNYGIYVGANLTTGIASDGTSHLTLNQSGDVAGTGIYVTANTTSGGVMRLIQSGSAGYFGISVSGAVLESGGAMTLSQTGSAVATGILSDLSTLKSGAALTFTQSGSAGGIGISSQNSIWTTTGDILLNQSGTVGAGKDGIYLYVTAGNVQKFTAGANNWVKFKTNNKDMSLNNYDNFQVLQGKVRIDLGSAKLTGGYTLKAIDLAVSYQGATLDNNVTIDVGGGSFSYITDRSDVTGAILTGTTQLNDAAIGWRAGFGSWSAGAAVNGVTAYSAGGVTVKARGGVSSVNGLGVIYGGTVSIRGVTVGSAVWGLNYIEGTGISITGSESKFADALTLVSNGSGITVSGTNYGIYIDANLAMSASNNGSSKLTLIQSGAVTGSGIFVYNASLSSGGAISLIQSGSTGAEGIFFNTSTLTSGRAMSLTQSGSAGAEGIL
ncbi:MAG: hypothetical protein ORN98_02420, partial [Alphaproteobacteria bacterium]|nr:hypothetical protein [Alphaproteobacteria bacterium]